MDNDLVAFSSALKFLSGETFHICRLCFASTEEEEYCLEDIVSVHKPFFDDSLSFIDMFDQLGVVINSSLPSVICMSCAATTINSFLFQKLCQYSDQKWSEVTEKLDETLTDANLARRDIQTAYLVINNKEKVIYTSKKRCVSDRKATILTKLKRIISAQAKYAKIKKAKPIKTEHKGQNYSNKSLEQGININKQKIPCPQCAKYFSSRFLLEDHAQRVHYPKTIKCPKCSQMFSTEKMLKLHERKHHVATICKLCFVQLPSKNALRSHLDKHDNNTCDQCGKVLINKQTYKLHMKICGDPNRKDFKFFCDLCSKGYARKNSLRTHLKTYHGFGRTYPCSWCGKKFDAVSRLRDHTVKHTRERNFYCEHCGGKFVTQAALVYHIRLHTGEKPYKCDLCDESFLSTSRRMEHKRRKHFQPTKECSVCHAKFPLTSQLNKHKSRHFDPHSKLYVPDLSYNLILKQESTSLLESQEYQCKKNNVF